MLLAGIAMVPASRLLLRTGLHRPVDGWRRGAGLVLREEAATFVLSAFGLDVWSDGQRPTAPSVEATADHCAKRLASFLAGEKTSHICIKREAQVDRAELADGPRYTLGFEAWQDGLRRFVRPECWVGTDCSTDAGIGAPRDVLFNIVARIDTDGRADLWVRVNHIGLDGVAAQEILSRLEAAWGACENVIYPTADAFAPHAGPYPCAGRSDLVERQTFLDFGPLLAWRKSENAHLPEPMTLSAAMLWCMGNHPAFAGIRIGTTVDMAATGALGRAVGVIVMRPQDYIGRRDGLSRYVSDFNRQLELTRRRSSNGCKSLDALALLPPGIASTLLRHALRGDRAFGSMGLTMIRDAKVFGAPMGDVGHSDGFIAIGNVALDAGGGRKVGCVTIKGPAQKTASYPTQLQDAIQRCR